MTREGDGVRTAPQVQALIDEAKATGAWPGAEEQWARNHTGSFLPTPFWDDTNKEVLPQGQVRMSMCCDSLRVTEQAFVGNALFALPGFDALGQMYPDVLHVWLLGIFLHLLGSTVQLSKDWLFRWVDRHGEPVLSNARWQVVLDRLENRLATFGSLFPSLAVSKFARRAAHRVDAQDGAGGNPGKGGANTSAAENSKLLCALATVLDGLLDEEINDLTRFYKDTANEGIIARMVRRDQADTKCEQDAQREQDAQPQAPGGGGDRPDTEFHQAEERRRRASRDAHLRRYAHPSLDPMVEVQEVWLALLDVYLQFREPQTDESGLTDLRRAICDLKHSFLRVFPNKSGQLAAWAFIKDHELDYIAQAIADLGNVDVASAQHGERAHQQHVKKDCAQTNRHLSFAGTVMRRDDMREMVREAIRLGTRPEGAEDDSDCWAFISREDLLAAEAKAKDSPNQGLLDCRHGHMDTHTWPIQHAAHRHLDMQRTLEVPGGDRCRTVAMSRAGHKPYSIPLSLLSSTVGTHSRTLALLDTVFALWLWRQEHGQALESPPADELVQHLQRRLPSMQVRLWNCLKLTNMEIPGHKHRIRSYPMQTRLFHRKQRQVGQASPATPPRAARHAFNPG